eukprot:CAMPEP_0119121182 /NCGR_PEP_ID=MMETSP1310-20130426/1931_1 /TAXON_ID=464262 /ORGANISM="Genus nov. species nov., Strain RCC2339" /LENGTH=899 /DNA_ID=CAMNT_0007110731 /DNA_START=21 /DNA_END=2716 /DNA_ORIENTATION=-
MTSKSGSSKFWIQYQKDSAPRQHDFAKEGNSLAQNIAKLCKEFHVTDSPSNYALCVEANGQAIKYITQQDLDAGISLPANSSIRLKVSPEQEAKDVIQKLRSGKLATQKKTVFDLSRNYLNDGDFVPAFLNAGGITAITDLIKTVSGGTLAYALAALATAMSYGYGWESIGEDVVAKIVQCILESSNIQVKSSSLKICAHMIGNEHSAGFWLVHHELVTAAEKRGQKPYEAVITALRNEDVNIKVGALQVINSFIEHAPDRTTFEEFLLLIENFGYLQELKAQLTTVTAVDFKKSVYWHQVAKSNHWGQEKAISYDKTNPDHEKLLMQLWDTCFPNTKLESRVSEQWKLLGFQGTDPGTDFRGMGILGLKHILYFAKKYTATFTKMASTQANRKSHYYPVSTAGINISAMLMEILNVGKKVENPDDVGEIFPILFDHPYALEEMYCLVFQMFHRVWDEMNADYMDFTNVAAAVKQNTINALRGSADLKTFRELLRVPLEHQAGKKENRRVSRLLDITAVQKEINTHHTSLKASHDGLAASAGYSFNPSASNASKRKSYSPGALPRGSAPNVSFLSRNSMPPNRHQPAGTQRHTAPADCLKGAPKEIMSESVTLDVYVMLANQCKEVTVSRESSVKAVIEMVSKALKKKMKKPKKGENHQLFIPSSGIWLHEQRKLWSYMLKNNERLELKNKPPNLNFRKVTIEIKLDSTSYNQPVEYLPDTSVRGIIQTIDKAKNIVQDINSFGIFIEGDGSCASNIWLEENRTLASYGIGSAKLVFSSRSGGGENGGKTQNILLQIQVDSTSKTMQFDENMTAAAVIARVCGRLKLEESRYCLYSVSNQKYLADGLPLTAYALTPSQVLVLKKRNPGFKPDRPVLNLSGMSLEGIEFRAPGEEEHGAG